MKILLVIAGLFVALVGMAMLRTWHGRRSRQQLCVNNMKMLHSAAVSYCLESKLGPDVILTMDDLVTYLKPGITSCPVAQQGYASFSVLQGPVCPVGHPYLGGEARPLRARDPKTAGLYLNFGLAHLVVPAAPSGGASNLSPPIGAKTNRLSSVPASQD